MFGISMSDFHAAVSLTEPLIVPILRRVRTDGAGPDAPIAVDSDGAAPLAVWRWTVPVADGVIIVHLHFCETDAMITRLWVLYRSPVVDAPQLTFIAAVREEVERRTGIHTDANWAITTPA